MLLRKHSRGAALLVTYVVVVWNSDNAAIVFGRAFPSSHPFPVRNTLCVRLRLNRVCC